MSIIINRIWPRIPLTERVLTGQEIRKINLKPVKQIVARFDPFHEKIEPTRVFMNVVSGYRYIKTNPSVKFSNEIVCDRSEPQITFILESGEEIQINTAEFSLREIAELYNKHITANIPPEEVIVEKATKALKKKKR